MHLSDCFIEEMAYVRGLVATLATGQPAYDEVRDEIRRLLSESGAHPSAAHFPPEAYDEARFAVCAWIDEEILASSWTERSQWLRDQLQRLHYNTTDAGEEFFRRLGRLAPDDREVREVYYLCLALGFTGRYCHPGDEPLLEQLKAAQLKLLLGDCALPSGAGAALFPEAHPRRKASGGSGLSRGQAPLATAACLAAPLFLFLILFLIYRFTLSGVSENFLRTVTN